jgi:serine/threonine-protein kinase
VRRPLQPGERFLPFDGTTLTLDAFDPKQDALVGRIVEGRYEIVRLLGEGGMGSVYEVRHAQLGRPFALKVLRADLAADPELAARFVQEAKATAAVKHPNVVGITDFGRLADERPFFVMELVEGRTLAQVLREEGALPPQRARAIGVEVARGLAAAHAAGVVHRDLKPENIVVSGRPETPVVKVLDFGAAILAGATRLTRAGVVFGTPHYMAPEQAAGEPVDHRADVYALGVILWQMLVGRPPFEGETYMGIVTQHLYAAPVPPSELRPELAAAGGPLEAIVLRALEKSPAQRFPTMEAFAIALAGAPAGPAIRSAPPPPYLMMGAPPDAVTPGAPRSRRLLGLALAGVAAVGVAVAAVLFVRAKPDASAPGTAFASTDAPLPPSATSSASPPVPALESAPPSALPSAAPPIAVSARGKAAPTATPVALGASASSSAAPLARPKTAPRPNPASTKPSDFVDPWAR